MDTQNHKSPVLHLQSQQLLPVPVLPSSLELTEILLPLPPGAGTQGMHHHTWPAAYLTIL